MTHKVHYLLDTDILSELIRNPQGTIAEKIESVGEMTVCTSVLVASELRFGAEKKQSEKLTLQVDIVLSAITILPYEEPADRHYAQIRKYLEEKGETIGPNDLLIAAHALAINCIVVTANEREFSRVPGLIVENWLVD